MARETRQSGTVEEALAAALFRRAQELTRATGFECRMTLVVDEMNRGQVRESN
jgi:hypothetical protein